MVSLRASMFALGLAPHQPLALANDDSNLFTFASHPRPRQAKKRAPKGPFIH